MLAEFQIKELIEERYINPLKRLSKEMQDNIALIDKEFKKSYNAKTKEESLLLFRRAVEMLLKTPLLLAVTSVTTNKTIAIRKENFLQFVDDRYYTPLKLVSFLDIFRIETNDYKALSNGTLINDPHTGLIITYIFGHFNNTFTRFTNRNMEYFYIYEFFYKNGESIKEILNLLNSYHYSTDKEWEKLYKVKFEDVKVKISNILKEVKKVLEKI